MLCVTDMPDFADSRNRDSVAIPGKFRIGRGQDSGNARGERSLCDLVRAEFGPDELSMGGLP